jgi:hypothetical protein
MDFLKRFSRNRGALIGAVIFTCLVLLRREFASRSRAVLLQREDNEM